MPSPYPPSSTSPLPKWCSKLGNGSCGHSITLCCCRSFSVTLCPCSNVGSLPRDTVPPELILCGLPTGSSSSTAPDMGLNHGVHPSGANCSSMGPIQAAALARSPAPVWAPLYGLQLQPGTCSSVVPPQASASISAGPPVLLWSPPWAAVWNPAPLWYSMGCRGTACFNSGPHHRPQGTSALVPGAPLPLLLH